MIEPVRMVKVRIVGSKDILDKSLETLYECGVVHIDEYKPGKYKIEEGYFDIGTPFERASKFSEQWVRIKALASALKLNLGTVEARIKTNWDCEAHLRSIEERHERLSEKIKKDTAEMAELKAEEEAFGFFETLKVKPNKMASTDEIAVIFGIVDKDFEGKLAAITKNYELFKSTYKNKTGFILLIPRAFENQAMNLLLKHKYKEVRTPENPKFNDLKELSERKDELQADMTLLDSQLEKFKEDEAAFLASYSEYLSEENEKAEAPLRLATTSNSFFIDGYVPVINFSRLKEDLGTRLGNSVYLEKFDKEVEFAPTQLKNPKLVNAFEFFLNMYSLPFYKELDPTFLIFLTFPLFFGFMLGDVGYGLVTLILFLIVKYKSKSPMVKGLMNAMILSSVSSIIFGFVFAEFFGLEMIGSIELHPLIARACALGGEGMMHCNPNAVINQMLFITVLVGFIHINTGYVLGFFNEMKRHGVVHAILAKLSWLVIEIGAALLLFQVTGKFITGIPYQMFIGAGILAVGIVMLTIGEGPMGLIEIPTLASNALSYARLFAIGLSSVALAVIINAPLKIMFGGNIFMAILGVVILVLGHLLNIALGIMGGFLQSLRLHYVEFFTKFYHGGGKRYDPFGGKE